jgi:arginyl-tRNA synthetase
MDGALQAELEMLDLHQPHLPECFPSQNPFDLYRLDISNALSEVTGIGAKTVYPLLQRTTTLDKGDLLLPVPALKIKGDKPDVLATRWAHEVIETSHAKL